MRDANQLTAPERSDLRRLEAVIEKGKQTFIEVGSALKQIRDDRLYREKWKTFEAYCEDKHEFQRAHAYRLIEASETVQAVRDLSPMGDKITNERQARILSDVPIEQMQEVLDNVAERVAKTDELITAKLLKEVVEEVVNGEPEPPKTKPVPTKNEQAASLRSIIKQHNAAMMRAVGDLHAIKPDAKMNHLLLGYFRSIDQVIGDWK